MVYRPKRVNSEASRSLQIRGCPESVAAMMQSDKIYLPFKNDSRKNIGTYAPGSQLRLSGYIWPENEKYLAEKGYLFVEPYGEGKLILFTEDPTFRAAYVGLYKLLINAILLGPSF